MSFTIYGKAVCKYCDMAKGLLTNKDIPFNYIDITYDEDAMEFMIENGFRSVPQIYNNGEHIGGYEDLVEYLDNN